MQGQEGATSDGPCAKVSLVQRYSLNYPDDVLVKLHMTYDHPRFQVLDGGKVVWSGPIHFEHDYELAKDGLKIGVLAVAVGKHLLSIGLGKELQQHNLVATAGCEIVEAVNDKACAWVHEAGQKVTDTPDIKAQELGPAQWFSHVKYHVDRANVRTEKSDACICEGPLDIEGDVLFDASGVVKDHLAALVKRHTDTLSWTQGLSKEQHADIVTQLVGLISDHLAAKNADEA